MQGKPDSATLHQHRGSQGARGYAPPDLPEDRWFGPQYPPPVLSVLKVAPSPVVFIRPLATLELLSVWFELRSFWREEAWGSLLLHLCLCFCCHDKRTWSALAGTLGPSTPADTGQFLTVNGEGLRTASFAGLHRNKSVEWVRRGTPRDRAGTQGVNLERPPKIPGLGCTQWQSVDNGHRRYSPWTK